MSHVHHWSFDTWARQGVFEGKVCSVYHGKCFLCGKQKVIPAEPMKFRSCLRRMRPGDNVLHFGVRDVAL